MNSNLTFLNIILLKITILTSLLFFCWLLLQYNSQVFNDLYKYKIKSSAKNWFYILCYLSLYVILILYIRYQHLNEITDLKPLFEFFIIYYQKLSLINFLYLLTVILLSICFFIIFLYKLHAFFRCQVISRYLFFMPIISQMPLHNWSIYKWQYFLEKILLKILSVLQVRCHIKLPQKLYLYYIKIPYIIVIICPTIILISLFLFDLYYNNFILSLTFYKYLLFYFIYQNYVKLSTFVGNSDNFFCLMIYDMYYNQRSVAYVNLPLNIQNVIEFFIKNGLYYEEAPNSVIANFYFDILCYYKYKSKDGFLYVNGNKDYFYDSNNIKLDTSCKELEVFINIFTLLYKIFYGLNKQWYCNASRLPTEKPQEGSNDPTNIN